MDERRYRSTHYTIRRNWRVPLYILSPSSQGKSPEFPLARKVCKLQSLYVSCGQENVATLAESNLNPAVVQSVT